jgi:hypothetical protein
MTHRKKPAHQFAQVQSAPLTLFGQALQVALVKTSCASVQYASKDATAQPKGLTFVVDQSQIGNDRLSRGYGDCGVTFTERDQRFSVFFPRSARPSRAIGRVSKEERREAVIHAFKMDVLDALRTADSRLANFIMDNIGPLGEGIFNQPLTLSAGGRVISKGTGQFFVEFTTKDDRSDGYDGTFRVFAKCTESRIPFKENTLDQVRFALVHAVLERANFDSEFEAFVLRNPWSFSMD